MANAVDAFRAQRESVEQLHARVADVSALVAKLLSQIDRLSIHADLKTTLRAEQEWLARAEKVIGDARCWRQQEMRGFSFAIFWRWALASVFALVSSGVGGAGYAWATRPYAAEIERLRPKAELADLIQRRLLDLTPQQRREFDRLLKLSEDPKR